MKRNRLLSGVALVVFVTLLCAGWMTMAVAETAVTEPTASVQAATPTPTAPVETATPIPIAPVETATPIPTAPVETATPMPTAPMETATPIPTEPTETATPMPTATVEPTTQYPYVLLYAFNSKPSPKPALVAGVLDVYHVLLTLLPDDAYYAYDALYNGIDNVRVGWYQRKDFATLQSVLSDAQDDRKFSGKLNTKDFFDLIPRLMASCPGSSPVTVLLYNSLLNTVDTEDWNTALNTFMGHDYQIRLIGFVGDVSTQNLEKLKPLLGLQAAGSEGMMGGSNKLRELQVNGSGSYMDDAFSDIRQILEERFQMEVVDAVVTPENSRTVITSADVPMRGAQNLKLLLRNVPDGQALYQDINGTETRLSELMSISGAAEGTTDRVYQLQTSDTAATQALTLYLHADSGAEAAPDATEAAVAGPGVTASFYFQFLLDTQSVPLQLDQQMVKNQPFRVAVSISDPDILNNIVSDPAFYQPFVRCKDNLGNVYDFNAYPSTGSNTPQLVAEVVIPVSGDYTIQSGVSYQLSTPRVQLSDISTALLVHVNNATPAANKTAVTLELMVNAHEPLSAGEPSANINMWECFTDTDNEASTLTYRLTEQEPTSFAQVEAAGYQLVKTGLYTAACDATTGQLTVSLLPEQLDQPETDANFFLVAYDNEGMYASIPVTVKVFDIVTWLDGNDPFQVSVDTQAAGESGSAEGQQVTVTADWAGYPEALRAQMAELVTVAVCAVPAGSDSADLENALWVEAEATSDHTWSARLDNPLQTGSFRVAMLALFQNDAASWSPSHWMRVEDNASFDVTYPVPDIAQNLEREITLRLNMDGLQIKPSMVSYDLSKVFSTQNEKQALTFDVDVVDLQNQPVDFDCLVDSSLQVNAIAIGCSDTYLQSLLTEYADLRLMPMAQVIGMQKTANPERAAVLVGQKLFIAYGAEGNYVIRFSARNVDSAIATYPLTMRVESQLRHTLRLVGIGLAALLALLAIALTVRQILKPTFGNRTLTLWLADPDFGSVTNEQPLACWRKRKIKLSELLLNTDFPAQAWLDTLADAIYLEPENGGLRVVAEKKVLQHLSIGDGVVSNTVNRMTEGTTVQIRANGNNSVMLDITLKMDIQMPMMPNNPRP